MCARLAVLPQLASYIVLLLFVMFLFEQAEAQHGGAGGGHSGGGHAGGHSGGHFGGSRSGGHSGNTRDGLFGWLHVGIGHRAVRSGNSGSTGNAETAGHARPELGNPTAIRAELFVPKPRVTPTLLWLPAVSHPHFTATSLPPLSFPHHHRFLHNHVSSFGSSGCFFNGVTQVCFFEPVFSLFCFSNGFDSFLGFGFGTNNTDDFNSVSTMQPALDVFLPTETPQLDASSQNLTSRAEAMADVAAEQGDKGIFLLVLKNGTLHTVTDYWLADGYIEYVGHDGGRSHIPLEALDLERTVAANSPRGLHFVLRSTHPDAR